MTELLPAHRRPYLRVDDVALAEDRRSVVLRAAGATYDVGPLDDAHGVAALLAELRDPATPRWRALPSEARPLVAQIDLLGLVGDDDTGVEEVAAAERADAEHAVAGTVAWLREAATVLPPGALDAVARDLLADADSLLAGGAGHTGTSDALGLRALAAQLRLWRTAAPRSLAAAASALRALLGEPPSDAASAIEHEHAGGVFEPADLRTHLSCLAALLVDAALPSGARRAAAAVPQVSEPRSGLNLMLAGEHAAVDALRLVGPTAYERAARTGALPPRVVVGTYVEQFHITRRYVEVITPLLTLRLRTPLRRRMFQYYDEELGHEVFELETCRALGVTEDAVRTSVPLPWWTAYVEVLTGYAASAPVSFLASVLVTEGMPGTRTPVNDVLADSGLVDAATVDDIARRHEQVNAELDHTLLARELLAHVPVVTAAVQRQALDDLVLFVELNARAWDDLYDYYADDTLPPVPGWLPRPPRRPLWTRSAAPAQE